MAPPKRTGHSGCSQQAARRQGLRVCWKAVIRALPRPEAGWEGAEGAWGCGTTFRNVDPEPSLMAAHKPKLIRGCKPQPVFLDSPHSGRVGDSRRWACSIGRPHPCLSGSQAQPKSPIPPQSDFPSQHGAAEGDVGCSRHSEENKLLPPTGEWETIFQQGKTGLTVVSSGTSGCWVLEHFSLTDAAGSLVSRLRCNFSDGKEQNTFAKMGKVSAGPRGAVRV